VRNRRIERGEVVPARGEARQPRRAGGGRAGRPAGTGSVRSAIWLVPTTTGEGLGIRPRPTVTTSPPAAQRRARQQSPPHGWPTAAATGRQRPRVSRTQKRVGTTRRHATKRPSTPPQQRAGNLGEAWGGGDAYPATARESCSLASTTADEESRSTELVCVLAIASTSKSPVTSATPPATRDAPNSMVSVRCRIDDFSFT